MTRPAAQLAVSTGGLVAGTIVANAPAFLIAHLHTSEGMTLAAAGTLAAAPVIGTALTLIAWGAVADRWGERVTLLTCLGLGALFAGSAVAADSAPAVWLSLFLAGAAVAGVNSASGRLVVGWYDARSRGTAIGIRQTATPMGVGVAALAVPTLAAAHGLTAALLVPVAACTLALLAVFIVAVDPPRPPVSSSPEAAATGTNPYTHDRRLLRIHGASVLLTVPQFIVWTYMLVWLVVQHEWSPAAAGALVAATQAAGAVGRIVIGRVSDLRSTRLRPMRAVALSAAITMFTIGALSEHWAGIVVMTFAAVVTVADNGLAFTAVAEISGPAWSGRALGAHNTGQFLAASAVPPVFGGVVALGGYGIAFAAGGLFCLAAAPLIPVRDESRPA